VGALALVALLCALFAAGASAKKVKEVEIVTQGAFPSEIPSNVHYFHKIQEAVEATKKGAWVLIEPGTYSEEVKVNGKAHSEIWIRGMDRNTVIIDGKHEPCTARGRASCPEGANGIEIVKTSDVTVENLTVRNFDQEPGGPGGNQIWWNGAAEGHSGQEKPGKIGATGWWGRYLTAYDDGLYGTYGIFTNDEMEGEWENIYASGFNDSGMYLGACQECEARITHATMEYSALGYSGSNSGGSLEISNSTFRHNATGVAPNAENPGDPPPVQDGECNRPKKPATVKGVVVLPEIPNTEIKHCTRIVKNLITENDNMNVPGVGSAAGAPFGAGVELPGDYADAVEENTITKNGSDGVLAFEYPNPFPPVPKVTIFFQNSGNRVANNTFSHNGTLGHSPKFEGGVAFEGGLFGSEKSLNNCISGNTFNGGDTTFPEEIETTWGCQNKNTPNPGGGSEFIEYLLYLQGVSEAKTPEAQEAPPAQPTMANPCREVPKNPVCP
jgi:hypothetical protein